MLDIKFIRENPDKIKQALKSRGVNFDVDHLIKIDGGRRLKTKEVDDTRAAHNKLSDEIAKLKGEEKKQKVEESKNLKDLLGKLEVELRSLEEEFTRLMYQVPNLPLDDVPVGKNENDNKVIREEGKKRKFGFKPRDYMEISSALEVIDTKRAAKVAGSRFGYLKREAVLLEFALVQFAFAHLQKKYGFVPVIPPVLIKDEIMRGMGYVDSKEDREERYFLEKDKLYLVGTAEQSIGPIHADEILEESSFPRRDVGFSTCFRREAGSYGKDTHGILRVHQFDKVEMVTFSLPENSREEHALMLEAQEELVQALKIPYRVVALCIDDLSQPSAATYDIESWLPGQNEGKGQYRETHSTSNTTAFQARRLNIKVRRKDGKTEFIHMLNGTAFAIGRTLIAILENYQQEDGSVKIPEVLQKYMGGLTIIKR
ncbi:MAG: serine--tRNA ligase [Candidatus Sungbacteria bacterium RIFCSPHIGHO2_02_FULL_47_11]|uniref:Serine--tRNA ligase n=1 Tax=Candidatus Sungbacteria bacterium RIFCSPHIGHO2_02_FULL_47_11 TaxID=1802270 RepID=A0A1G2KFK4_9BACT|nr:MAG: serine--tRNA ligase [Candidatus Sungbacteria bacterium RIFCSPHIGHO2_02_FULL_47_11]